jgi:hypothetical protein
MARWRVSWDDESGRIQEQLKDKEGEEYRKSIDEAKEALRRWNDRIDQSMQVAAMSYQTLGEHGHRFFAYMLRGNLVGLMLIGNREGSSHLYIEWLATHPGSEGGGGILIEHAVNLSEEGGGAGRLELTPMDEASRAVYTALGFIKFGKSSMLLCPDRSEKWVKLEGRWHLAKYQERKGFAGPA